MVRSLATIDAPSLTDDGVILADQVPLAFSKGGILSAPYSSPYRFYVNDNYAITLVQIGVGTAPTGATLIVDVNKNGTTIFTTQGRRPTIAISGFSAINSGAIENGTLAAGDYITIDVDQVGSTVAGSSLTVVVWVKRV